MLFYNSCFFYDPTDIGNLISDSSAFSKYSLNIWKFMVHVLLKPGLENFEHYFVSVWDEFNCGSLSILWDCLSLGLKWKLTFSSPVATAEFSKFAGILKLLSRVRLFVTPWTVAYQAPLSMGFSWRECWSGLPFPSPGDLPNPGIEPGSPTL